MRREENRERKKQDKMRKREKMGEIRRQRGDKILTFYRKWHKNGIDKVFGRD